MMSGLAVFSLKHASLLQFDQSRSHEMTRHNLKSLSTPYDPTLRERLDEVDPQIFEKMYKRLFARLQRSRGLEGFEVLDGRYVLSVDGTGMFSSNNVHCGQCCRKHHRDGRVTYYHQTLSAVRVHPDCRKVIPLMPESIMNRDGSSKNDCERNAAKRLLERVRHNHPHLQLVVVDALASNGPHIRLLGSLNMRYVPKEPDHRFLYDWVEQTRDTRTYEDVGDAGVTH